MSEHKLLRAILILLTLFGLGFVAYALWGKQLDR